jgi:hypothetical protein
MPNLPHEALHRVFRESPGLFAETLHRVFDADFPDIVEAHVVDTDLTEIKPMERRPDTVLRAETSEGPQLLVVEAQNREDPSKIRSWAYYLSFLENKYQLPATLLITTPLAETARWARRPLRLGPPEFPSMEVFPFVAGPDNVPFITEVEEAVEDVDFAVLSTLTHRFDPDIEKALRPLASALNLIDPKQGAQWADLTESGLGEGCANQIWRKIMKAMPYEFVSELAQEARAHERARIILSFLDDRGIEVSEAERGRIETCTDSETLARWVMRAPYVGEASELFAD